MADERAWRWRALAERLPGRPSKGVRWLALVLAGLSVAAACNADVAEVLAPTPTAAPTPTTVATSSVDQPTPHAQPSAVAAAQLGPAPEVVVIPRAVPVSGGTAGSAAVPRIECPTRVLFNGLPLVTFECTITNFGASGPVAWLLELESGGVQVVPRRGVLANVEAGETVRMPFAAFLGDLPSTYRFGSSARADSDPTTDSVQVFDAGDTAACAGCFEDPTNDFFHTNPNESPLSVGLDIFDGGSLVADISNLRRLFERDGPLACGSRDFASTYSVVACDDDAEPLPDGPVLLLWMRGGQRFGLDVHTFPFATGTSNVEVVAGFETDGNPDNNTPVIFGTQNPRQNVDRWYEVTLNARSGRWHLFQASIADGSFKQLPTAARFILIDPLAIFVIPLSEFEDVPAAALAYRLGTFTYDLVDETPELVTAAGDITGSFGVPLRRIGR